MVPALAVRDLHKSFGGVDVLRGITYEIDSGQLAVLAGENGAGKSTLMKIVTGQLHPDRGEVHVDGIQLTHATPRRARALGVAIVPQELAPYPELTVYENLFVGRELRNAVGLLNRRAMIARTRDMLSVFELDVTPTTPMRRLPLALTQLVEIIKATTWGATVLLLDEPTSSIPEREVDRLYTVIKQLKQRGVAMLYTTHRMSEIDALADQVVVLRDGELTLNTPAELADEHQIVTAMVGRELRTIFPALPPCTTTPALTVCGLRLNADAPAVDLQVHAGEIVGLGGLVGAGRTEILEAIFGLRRPASGTVEIDAIRLSASRPASAIRAGVALVPEDRKGAGLVLSRSVLDNIVLPHLQTFCTAGWLRRSRSRPATRAASQVRLKSAGLGQLVQELSGGNQQKVVIARWLTREITVLLLDEPTRGVDVGARSEIYTVIAELAAHGLAVLLVSSDMPELIGMTHRVAVLRNGAIVGELTGEELHRPNAQEQIFRYASGQLTKEPQK